MYKTFIPLNENINKDIRENILEITDLFQNSGKEIYLVGGSVRDIFLGKEPKDYDLCTNAKPEEIKEILKDKVIIDTGIKHGTVTVIYKGKNSVITPFEITTYRCDGLYKDGRHPESVEFVNTLEEDLKRRDLTVNAMAYDVKTENIICIDEQPFDDAYVGIIRTVGKAEDRYNEDALRMLRTFRFAAQLGFTIEPETFEAVKKCAPLISKVSKERIREELTKILMSDNPQALELMCVSGLEQYLFDGTTPITDCLYCEHKNQWHYTDVFHHTMDVVKRVPKKFELRWAALFHDLGKPVVRALKEGTTGTYTYYGHPVESVKIAENIMNILKFSNQQKDIILKYVKYHDESLAEVKISTFKRIMNDISNFKDYMELRKADTMAHRLLAGTKYALDQITKIYERYIKVINDNAAFTIKDLNINGYDIMKLGFEGKEIGDCLKYLLEQVLSENVQNEFDDLLKLAKDYRTSLK